MGGCDISLNMAFIDTDTSCVMETYSHSPALGNTNVYSKLKCWYTNATSLNNKFNEFEARIYSEDPDVVLVTETWWKSDSIVLLDNYILYRCDRCETRGGGVAIYIKSKYLSTEPGVSFLNGLQEQVWCEVHVGKEKILVGCLYRAPNASSEASLSMHMTIENAKRLIDDKYTGMLIGGDFNYPQLQWSSELTTVNAPDDSLPSQFNELLVDSHLIQFVYEPTFQLNENTNKNVLDLVISESPDRIYDMNYDPPLSSNDKNHVVLTWDFYLKDRQSSGVTINKLNFVKGNYSQMNNYFDGINWDETFENKTVEQCYDSFLDHYNHVCSSFIPLKSTSNYRSHLPWLSKEIRRKIRTKNNLWRSNRRNKWSNNEMKREYTNLKHQLKREVINAKHEFEESLIERSKKNPKLVYSYIKKRQTVKSYVRSLISSDGEILTSSGGIANALNEQFTSVFVKNENDNIPPITVRTVEEQCPSPKFTCEIVRDKILSLKPFKSVGVDNINGFVLRKCAETLTVPISKIFNKSFSTGELPSTWKQANITPLFKKGSRLDPSNYRPVSLTSIVCKLMESIIKDTIVSHLEKYNLINANQHGFVKNKSCTTNLMEAIDLLSYNLWKKIPSDVVFLDFAKAFDTVPHKRLIAKLRAYGLNECLVKWIESFLHKRQQRVVMGDGVSFWAWVLSGVPQGSVLGPLLFIIYINDLCENLHFMGKLYADDTKIISSINSINDSQLLQADLNKIHEWSTKWLVQLNRDKCKVMHLGYHNQKYKYYINDESNIQYSIQSTECEKDLGVMIQSDLKWHNHVGYVCARANRIIGMLRRTFVYLNVRMVSQLYKVFVRPHLEYAVSVWCPYHISDINQLDRVQHRMTRLMPNLSCLPYKERLRLLTLPSLCERRTRGDLIQMHKLISGVDNISWYGGDFYNLPSSNRMVTRGHDMKLVKEIVRGCNMRFNFFCNRVVTPWNGLSFEAVHANSINEFKSYLF